ncbi:hypothetical protein L596_011646 [Steinernema carpocapsae]|uniref:Fungal lipase-type domain-containing protein n=1 Tax=Steinernema carpocapsae TaxID=34508 RepID=A0A4V6A4J4_STECR|nr:hypothetical protein L596_011646 [Steinernema carpocapsae]
MKVLAYSAALVVLCVVCVEAKECEELRSCAECTKAVGPDGVKCDWCTESSSCTRRFSRKCPKKFRVGGIPYNCPVPMPPNVRYNETFVKKIVFPFIALAPETNRTRLERNLKCSIEGVQLVGNYHVPATNAEIMIPLKAIVISFRGSVGIPQLLNQAYEFLSPPTSPFAATGGQVYTYYHMSFLGVWSAGMAGDVRRLAKLHPHYEIWSFGLSLGGALASLASSQVVADGLVPSSRIKLITFGQPRVGNVVYAEAHDRLVPFSFRVISARDVIPAVGKGRAMHHRYEVWYPKGMKEGSEFRISDQAESRAGFLSATSHNAYDHLVYYGHDLITYYREYECPAAF